MDKIPNAVSTLHNVSTCIDVPQNQHTITYEINQKIENHKVETFNVKLNYNPITKKTKIIILLTQPFINVISVL